MSDTLLKLIIIAQLVIIVFLVAFVIYVIRKNIQENVTEEDVLSLVNEGHEDGNILAKEAEMIQNIFEFSDTDVKDIMTHRKNIVEIDGETSLNDAISIINQNHHSRYPVYIDEPDNIIGILHIKDVLLQYNDFLNTPIKDIPDLLSVAEFVPETHSISALFSKMQSKKRHMVIVVDEYGQVSGILSLEDILEEIVGNIEDEHDEHEQLIEQVQDNTYMMKGSTPLNEAEELLKIHLSDDYETLNGYLISLLGKIPDDGSSFSLEDQHFTYEIKNVTSKVIDDVFVIRKSSVTN